MKKRTAKRIVTFLLAVVMAAAMPISINAAESPAEPLSVNAKTATFNRVSDMYFAFGDDEIYGKYDTTVVFKSASDTSKEIYSATVYPDINWSRRLPDGIGEYRVKVIFQAEYQRLNHYSYGNVTQSYEYKFNYNNDNSGIIRIPSHTFLIKEPTDDSLGFKNWVNFCTRIEIYSPRSNENLPDDFVSFESFTVQYGDVIKQF